MSVKITYFVHGTTTDNEQRIASGWFDVGLSELGIKQSIELKDQTKDRKFDVVFCSDLKRAADSAKLAFEEKRSSYRMRDCASVIMGNTMPNPQVLWSRCRKR